LRDCEIVRLPRGAAGLGALAFEGALRGDADRLALVQRLPVSLRAPAVQAAGVGASLPASDRPTHVVYRGRAWTLGREPLAVGAAVPAGRRALVVPAGPGLSRIHCTLVRDADGAWLEDCSTYGTLLNGERVGSRVGLRAGDRLRLGNPGVELELVRVVDGDGAA